MSFKNIFLLLIFLLPIKILSQPERYYQKFSSAIIRLENSITHAPVGTAFFIRCNFDTQYYYLVTARHVVEPNIPLRARVPSIRLDNNKTEVLELRLPKDIWIYHPKGYTNFKTKDTSGVIAPVDVAVTKVSAILNHDVGNYFYDRKDDLANQILRSRTQPPMPVTVWGYPLDIGFRLREQHPMARAGIIAMSGDEPYISVKYPGGKYYLRDEQVLLIDAPILHGNSGGPVVYSVPNAQKNFLIGLISATNIDCSFGIIEPSTRIIETIEHAYAINQKVVGEWYNLK